MTMGLPAVPPLTLAGRVSLETRVGSVSEEEAWPDLRSLWDMLRLIDVSLETELDDSSCAVEVRECNGRNSVTIAMLHCAL